MLVLSCSVLLSSSFYFHSWSPHRDFLAFQFRRISSSSEFFPEAAERHSFTVYRSLLIELYLPCRIRTVFPSLTASHSHPQSPTPECPIAPAPQCLLLRRDFSRNSRSPRCPASPSPEEAASGTVSAVMGELQHLAAAGQNFRIQQFPGYGAPWRLPGTRMYCPRPPAARPATGHCHIPFPGVRNVFQGQCRRIYRHRRPGKENVSSAVTALTSPAFSFVSAYSRYCFPLPA